MAWHHSGRAPQWPGSKDRGHSLLALARGHAPTQRAPTAPDAPTAHCGPLVLQVSLVDEGRRLVPLVYYADGGGLYEGAAATAALP